MRSRIALVFAAAMVTVGGCGIKSDNTQPAAPPARPAVILDERVHGWQTSAWLTAGALCIRAARTSGSRASGQEHEGTFCDPVPEELTRPGPPLLPAKPMPQLYPLDPQQRDIILIGTVRGTVTEVSVTMFGHTATAAVHRLPAPAGIDASAYAVWLPRTGPGRADMNLEDITAVTGRDSTGRIVTEIV